MLHNRTFRRGLNGIGFAMVGLEWLPFIGPQARIKQAAAPAMEYIRIRVRRAMDRLEINGPESLDLSTTLGMILSKLSKEERIEDHVVGVTATLLVGIHTLFVALTFGVWLLGAHPDAQEKVRKKSTESWTRRAQCH